MEPREWCFPIVGCVAYRGYFRAGERREVRGRACAREGFDTIVGGVPAYSTLGKFNDPILNTMMTYGDDELASIMFHELSHQLVYIADDTSFNEAFAVTVEQEGLARWLKFRGREADLVEISQAARAADGRRGVGGAVSPRACDALPHGAARRRDARAQGRGVRAAGARAARARLALRNAVGPRRRARWQAQQCAARVARDVLRMRAGLREAARRRATRSAAFLRRGPRTRQTTARRAARAAVPHRRRARPDAEIFALCHVE